MDEKAHDKDHSLELEISKPNSNKVIHSENKKKNPYILKNIHSLSGFSLSFFPASNLFQIFSN